jgi:hypothetical protein
VKKLFFLIVFILSLLANTQTFANDDNFDSTRSLRIKQMCETYLYRLNTLLNNNRLSWYLRNMGYQEHYIFEECSIADCWIEECVINITLYFAYIPGNHRFFPVIGTNVDDVVVMTDSQYSIEQREKFSLDIYSTVMSLCREFVYEWISEKDVKLVVKKSFKSDKKFDTLFVWENGEIKYLPIFFDQDL